MRVREWRSRYLPYVLLAPVLVYLLVMFAFPISRVLVLSFFDPGFTVGHYLRFFRTPLYSQVLVNTFEIAATVTAICLLLGYPTAYVMSEVKPRTAAIMALLVVVPFWISILVRTYAWMVILGRYGLINNLLLFFGWASDPVKLMGNRFGVLVGMVHFMLPIMILTLFSVMKNIDRNLLKAAQSLGANRTRTFVSVFLPLSAPGVIAGTLLVFIVSLGFFVTPAILGGNKEMMMAMLIETAVNVRPDWGVASSIAVVLLVVTLSLYFLIQRTMGLDRLLQRIG
jgi:putative spermidine/putrescine transport system permease protein